MNLMKFYGKIVWFCWYMLDFAFKIISLGITICFCILMRKITREDRIVIKALQVEKNWSSHRFLKEFASKAWCRASLDRLIKKIDAGFLKICITPLLVVCSLHLQKNH